MPIDFNTLVQLSKIISQLNENPVRSEQNLLQKDFLEKTTQSKSYTVQLGDSRLILFNKKNSKHSQEERQKFFEQLMGLDSSTSELRAGF
jgi:serine/threonine protein phosphatase PrpC